MENATAEEIAVAKACSPRKEGFIRFQALEMLIGGYGEEEVARISDRAVRTIRRWVGWFNESGTDGLALKGSSGRPRKIEPEKFKAEYIPLLLEPGRAGETHWTALKFHGYLREEYQELLSYSTLLRYIHENDAALRYPRRWPERQNGEERAKFPEVLRGLYSDDRLSVWFADEAGFEGDPRPRRIWVKKGSKPRVPYLGDHIREGVVGAVNPKAGDFFSLIVPQSDSDIFQAFLDEFAKHTSVKEKGKKTVLIIDNASWHKNTSIRWHHITPVFLPAYSPDLNPIEAIWRVLKERFFTGWTAKTPGDLVQRICSAIRSLIADEVSSIASIDHLLH